MAQVYKDSTQVEVKCSADKFFEIITTKTYLVPKICPDKIQSCEFIVGDGKTVGSVKFWKFFPSSGNAETAKDIIEGIDLVNKKITSKVIEGILLTYYKNFRSTVAISTECGKTLVKGDLEYEKLNEAFPSPTQYLEFFVAYARDIETYLSKH